MTLLIFLLVFLTVVIIHELGHFSAARAGKVQVEEFAVGLPPRAFRYWRGKGSININGQRVEIPRNHDLPFDWRTGDNKEVAATVDDVDGKLVLRTIELVKTGDIAWQEPGKEPAKNTDGVPLVTYGEKPVKVPGSQKSALRGAIELRGIATDIITGTEYTVNWLPLGGFMRPKGENDPDAPGGLAAASPWIRLGVLVAGPAMNLIAGVLVYSLIFAQTGVPNPGQVILVEVSPNSPAEQAGLMAGDLIVSANDKSIASTEAIRTIIYANMDQPVTVVYERDGEQYSTTVVPSSERTAEEGATGVLLGNPVEKASLLAAVSLGFRVTGMQIVEILTLPARLIQGTIPADQARFIGLKGMYDFMSQAVTRDQQTRQDQASQPAGSTAETPTYYTLMLIATLTISLGIFNLLPFPALDGGRIIFLLPELIFRRRVPPRIENTVHAVGITLLLVLMLYINVMDFVNPIAITLP
jgi:regulator of sigma E protease